MACNQIYEGDQDSRQKLTLRRATEADLPDIMRIEWASFPTPWSEWAMRAEISATRSQIYLVATVDQQLVGYVGGRRFADTCHIGTLAVDAAHRRQGLGQGLLLTLLLHLAQNNATEVTLEHRTSNKAAEQLYRKVGFQQVRIQKGYYRATGEDACELAIADLGQWARHQELREQWQAWRQRYGYNVEIIL